MKQVEMKGAPSFDGWLVAAGMGLAAFGVAVLVGGMGLMQAAFVGAGILVLAGLVLGMLPPSTPYRPASAAMAPQPAAFVPAPAPVAAPPVVAPVAAPVMAAPVAAPAPSPAAEPGVARKPEALTAARGGVADDLKIIKGIGPKLEVLCHTLGFYHFDQIAGWTEAEIAWVDDNLEGFKGRVTRDRWVPQARAIVTHGPEEFLRRLAEGHDF